MVPIFKYSSARSVLLTVALCGQFIAVQGQSDGDLRLNYNGSAVNRSFGRLEVFYSGQWGTVCDDSFSPNDARVACRQLGYSTYSRYGSVGAFGFSEGSPSQTTWLDDLGCSGSESRLVNCRHNGYGNENCDHSEDVGLVCTSSNTSQFNGDLRLVSSSGSVGGSAGRLEVYYSGQWGTVCDDSFTSNDANVACRQLGYSRAYCYGRVGSLGYSQASTSMPTWLDDLRCTSTDTSLLNCAHNGVGVEDCSHYEDVALVCSYRSSCSGSSGGGSGGGGTNYGGYYYGGGGVSGTVFLVVCCGACCFSSKRRRRRAQANAASPHCRFRNVCPTTVITSSRTTTNEPQYAFNTEMTARSETNKQANTTLQQQDSPPVYPGTDSATVPYPSQNISSSNTLPPFYPAESAKGLYPDAPPPYPALGFENDNPA